MYQTTLFTDAEEFKVSSSAGKVIASVYWDVKGIIMIQIFGKGGHYYGLLLRRSIVSPGQSTCHKAVVAMAASQEAEFELLEHLPYSPDLVLSDLIHIYNTI